MRSAALVVAVVTIVAGVVGIVSPEYGTMVRRAYFAIPARFYTAGALRAVMGIVVIGVAARSRAPMTLRVLGALMCMQALTGTVLGPEHARGVMEWENRQGPTMLRIGAAVSLVAGAFIAFAVTGPGGRHAPAGRH